MGLFDDNGPLINTIVNMELFCFPSTVAPKDTPVFKMVGSIVEGAAELASSIVSPILDCFSGTRLPPVPIEIRVKE